MGNVVECECAQGRRVRRKDCRVAGVLRELWSVGWSRVGGEQVDDDGGICGMG